MYCQKNLALLLISLTACAGAVTIVPKPSEYVQKDLASYADYDRPEDSSAPVQKLLDRSQTKEAKDDIYKWWLNSAVLELEKERPMGTGELIAACLHTPPSADTYAIKGHPKPDQIYENDLRFYNVMVESNNRIADRYRLIRALTKSAEGEYSHKDDLRALALRGLVAYERLLDHHRFILRQIQQYDCLSGQAPGEIKFEDEALKTYQGMVKNLKRSGEMLADLQGFVDSEFDSLSKPLADKRVYAGKLDLYSFEHRIFGENTEDADKQCMNLAKGAPNFAFKAYACGYVAEKNGHDSKAAKFYALAKNAAIEYAGPAAQRTKYLEDWNSPLQTEESRKAEGQAEFQSYHEYK